MKQVTQKLTHFSMEQTVLFKGIGILLIVLHNFFHNLTPIIGENEFVFYYQFFWNFWHFLASQPEKILQAVFAYFGHYGVQVFVFFSAYGLTRKYYFQAFNYRQFLYSRVNKIYFSFLLCLAVYIVLGLAKSVFFPGSKVLYWDSLLWKALLVSNFMPGQALMPVGPWWFLPFIMQVYIFFPFLLKCYKKYGDAFSWVMVLLAWLAKLYLNPYLVLHNLNINHTIVGHLPVIFLGMVLAAQPVIKISAVDGFLALLVFIVANFNPYVWIVSDLAFTIVFLSVATSIMAKPLPKPVEAFLVFYGTISFQLFLVNGFLRTPFHQFVEKYDVWWLDDLTALGSLAFATLFAYGLKMVDDKLRDWFFRKRLSNVVN